MDTERWARLKQIYTSALDLEPGSRESFLRRECAGDDALFTELASILSGKSVSGGLLESPALYLLAREIAADQADQADRLLKDMVGRDMLHYRLVDKIGAGGMGVVYRAEDGHLKRPVAIKVLPPEKLADPARRTRFVHEARASSALNHPNIVTIYDINSADGIDFIAMEYIAGQSLATLIRDKGLPLEQTLDYAIQIADGLASAHRGSIVHRDLKPSNIMVTSDGLVKVLDFGLAKVTGPAIHGAPEPPDQAKSLTGSGAIIGTAAYMSPEQAEGKAVDARSDIFSFGAVLYEMVTGRQAFKGDSNISTLLAVLHENPAPVSKIRPETPHSLDCVISRCLQKEPERRYRQMAEVKTALEKLRGDSLRRVRSKAGFWIVTAAVIAAALGFWAYRSIPPGQTPPAGRIIAVTATPGWKAHPSFSPDGNWIVFTWVGEELNNWDIYVQELGGTGFNRLTTDPAADGTPTWSPDGRQIAFLRRHGDQRTLYLISPLGGAEQKITEFNGERLLSWSPDGKKIAFVARESTMMPFSIWEIAVETREKRQVTRPPPDIPGDGSPAFSPDGRYLAFLRLQETGPTFYNETEKSSLYVMPLPNGQPRLVTTGAPNGICWTHDSREIVFATSGASDEAALWRVSIDRGEPRRIPARGEAIQWPAIDKTGNRLIYSDLAWNRDIWRLDFARGGAAKPPTRPLISSIADDDAPNISPDGRQIAFCSLRSGTWEIWICNADGTSPVQLTRMKAKKTGHPRWSPDGTRIAFDSTKYGNSDLFVVGTEGGQPRRLTTEPTQEVIPRWSLDGRQIYFGTNRSGTWQIWRMPAESGAASQITREGGLEGIESADGYLYYSQFYTQKRGIWRVPLSGGPETLVMDGIITQWDSTAQRFYYIGFPWYGEPVVQFYDRVTRKAAGLAAIADRAEFCVIGGISVSPDMKYLLYSGGIMTCQFLMIDNFH